MLGKLLAAVFACALVGALAQVPNAVAADDPVARVAAATCPGAKARISKASARKLRSALLCLVNRKRASHGLKALRLDRKLQRAAGRHARDMVKHDYFAHQRAGGPDLTARLDRVGWNGEAWGENIAYGCGSSGSPKATIDGWMNSPPHRENLLRPAFRRIGLGAVVGEFAGYGGATVVTADFAG